MRRAVRAAVSVALLACGTVAGAPPATREGEAPLTLTLTIDGLDYDFTHQGAEDLGDYRGEFVHQKCFRAVNEALPYFTVFFRPDADGRRDEVVVEYGRLWNVASPSHLMRPYTAVVRRGDRTLATVKVPYHWWMARWRWHTGSRPVVRRPAELTKRGWLPPFDQAFAYGAQPRQWQYGWRAPMGTAGLVTAMGMAGDRDDIGLVTEAQADYILNGGKAALNYLLSQGEACSSMPFHFRDERTGSLVDVYAFPLVSNQYNGDPVLPYVGAAKDAQTGTNDPRFFSVDTAHTPAAAFLPYALTDDPFFLEELECQAAYAVIWNSGPRATTKLQGLVYPGGTRDFAWSMRNLFQMGVVAPESPPQWLKPKSYWRRSIADNRAYAQLFIDSPAQVHRLFRAFTRSDMISGWQNSYLAVTLAYAVGSLGYEDWRDVYEWFMGGVIPLCDGRSGWNRQWPTPYYYHPLRTHAAHPFLTLVPDAALDSDTCPSWHEAWEAFKSKENIDDRTWDGHSIMQEKWTGYFLYLRASLAMGARLDIVGAQESLSWLQAELPRVTARNKATGLLRWAIR